MLLYSPCSSEKQPLCLKETNNCFEKLCVKKCPCLDKSEKEFSCGYFLLSSLSGLLAVAPVVVIFIAFSSLPIPVGELAVYIENLTQIIFVLPAVLGWYKLLQIKESDTSRFLKELVNIFNQRNKDLKSDGNKRAHLPKQGRNGGISASDSAADGMEDQHGDGRNGGGTDHNRGSQPGISGSGYGSTGNSKANGRSDVNVAENGSSIYNSRDNPSDAFDEYEKSGSITGELFSVVVHNLEKS